MKLASLKEGGRDGSLIVVSGDLRRAVRPAGIAKTMQDALDRWHETAPLLNTLYEQLNAAVEYTRDPHPVAAAAGETERLGGAADFVGGIFDVVPAMLAAPLPRAYEFVDGSAYLPHVERVRRARKAEVPQSFYVDPLMYQATSAGFHGPCDDVPVRSEEYGIDFEAEVVVVTDDVPMGVTPEAAAAHIQLVGLVNDVSLRNLIPDELAKGFGFLQSKPRSTLSPVFVTPDELGDAWRDSKLHLALRSAVNGTAFGAPEAGEDMQFSFAQLIAHAAKTRPLAAGSIVGSGTIANQDESVGASCLAEKRMLEVIAGGQATTPFLRFGDRVRIEMLDAAGRSIFGAIDQRIVPFGG
jgi:fumarylacetoacetate (FAA) hydrolase